MELNEAITFLANYAQYDRFDIETLVKDLENYQNILQLQKILITTVTAGEMTPDFWYRTTSLDIPIDFSPAFGDLLNRLVEHKILPHFFEGEPNHWTYDSLRLWAYTDDWLLSSQDEDLLLMSESLISLLLKVAVDFDCHKRDDILDAVTHGIRDRAFAHAGTPDFSGYLARVSTHIPAAEAAGADELVNYMIRLEKYDERGKVDREGAIQRALDLNRCYEPPLSEVKVERAGKWWIVELPGHIGKRLKVSAVDGKIFAD